jgi:hypothetical protein
MNRKNLRPIDRSARVWFDAFTEISIQPTRKEAAYRAWTAMDRRRWPLDPQGPRTAARRSNCHVDRR